MGTLSREPSSGPLHESEAAALFEPLRLATRLLLAVSGGPDSTALMHLAAAARHAGHLPPLVVATVDHGLQASSRQVALDVTSRARALGLEARLLRWEGPKPRSALQEAARRERYRLLDGLASEIGGAHLVTAHTLDDQAETILFRLARGSGPLGLAGMRPGMWREGVMHVRPFLDVPKRRLVDSCLTHGWPFVEDAANHDARYARARLRRLVPALAAEGLDARTLARLALRLARDEAALDALAATLAAAAALPTESGRRSLDADILLTSPAAIALRALGHVLKDFARPGPPPLGGLERLEADLRTAHAGRVNARRTLHGHVVSLRASRLDVEPEGPRRRGLVPSGESAC